MNRLFTRITAGALAAICILSAAACGEKKPAGEQSADNNTPAAVTDAPVFTDAPTSAPTEVPTEAPTPTPEPTATAIPWITDPDGHVPTDVEIVLMQGQSYGFTQCIVAKDEKYYAQTWKEGELGRETLVPAEILQDAEYINMHIYNEKYEAVEVAHIDGTYSIYFINKEDKIFFMRGYVGYNLGTFRELLIEHNVLIVIDYELENYYCEYKLPEEYYLEYHPSSELWMDKKTNTTVWVYEFNYSIVEF